MSSSSLDFLKRCLDSSKLLQKTINDNKVIADFNSEQSAGAGAAKVIWDNRKQAHENTNNTNITNHRNFLVNNWIDHCVDTNIYGCGDTGSLNCPSGWERYDQTCIDSGNCAPWNRYSRIIRCKRNAQTIESELNTWKTANIFPFNEPEPKAGEGDYYFRDPIEIPPVNIQCCGNYVDINSTGTSSVSLEGIQQNCNQSIEQSIFQIEQSLTTTPSSSSTTTILPSSTTTSTANSSRVTNSVTPKTQIPTTPKTQIPTIPPPTQITSPIILFIGGSGFLFSISICIIIILSLLIK